MTLRMNRDPPPPQDVYATNLQLNRGYPLRIPEPNKKLGEPYAKEGFQIGEVGYVNNYGEFNLLFNIGFPLPDELRKRGIPPYEPIQFNKLDSKSPEALFDQMLMTGVEWQANEPRVTYKFTATSNGGAILIVPSGATLSELQEPEVLEEFQGVAMKYALPWCKHSRCESLYLITGVYKTQSWTLGAFNKGRPGGDIFVERQDSGMYKWKYTFEVDFRPGPGNNNYENQTIIIKGFKMTVRQPPGIQPLAVIEQVTGSQSALPSWISILLALLASIFAISPTWLPRIATVERNPRLSQPLHPSDLINRYLLDENPGARVAITHDNEWIDILEKKRLTQSDLMQEGPLREFLAKEYVSHSDHDTVYLRSQIKDTDDTHYNLESSQPIPATEDVQVVITHIRAENVTVGLGRIPIGFYVQVDFHGATSRRTKNKPVQVYDSIIQWDDQIQLPSDPSAMVRLAVCASFEFSPILGKGEPLRIMEISVSELLDRTEPILFSEREGEAVSPCSSLLIAVQQWHCNHRTLPSSQIDGNPDWEESSELARITDLGHDALLRYHKDHSKADLESSVAHFERVLDICPEENAHRAAALSNLATAKFIAYQSHGASPDFNTSTSLYQEALKLRRDRHPDRPATLLHLSQALLYHYGVAGYNASKGELQKHVDELMDICPERTHERRAARLVHQTYELLKLRDSDDLVQLDTLISTLDVAAQEPPEAYFDRPIRFNNLSLALLRRFQLRRDASDLDRAIKWLEETVRITPDSHLDKPSYLSNLSNALLARFQRQFAVISTGQVEDSRILHNSS